VPKERPKWSRKAKYANSEVELKGQGVALKQELDEALVFNFDEHKKRF
jgi:hypothetical protein